MLVDIDGGSAIYVDGFMVMDEEGNGARQNTHNRFRYDLTGFKFLMVCQIKRLKPQVMLLYMN